MRLFEFNLFEMFQIIIFTLFSFAVSIFISDKFKFSKNKFIKFIQNFVIFNSILALICINRFNSLLLELDVSIFNTIFIFCDSDDEVKELKESSIFEYFNSLYNQYIEYLDTLTPDKIVCVFNIIIGGLTLSSFVSVLSIMLSDNVINRIKFLDRFPKILAILKLRNKINKGIAKVYLIIHLVLILGGILSNIYMLFL